MRQVNVHVDRPSCIELHVQEMVRIDRLTPTADGYVAAQHGVLLAPGVTQVRLEAGLYHLRTLDDAQLRVIAGGVQATSPSLTGKDPWPQPPPLSATHTDGTPASVLGVAVALAGHGPCGRVPVLRVVYATAGALQASAQASPSAAAGAGR
jgi:hypothetical protein